MGTMRMDPAMMNTMRDDAVGRAAAAMVHVKDEGIDGDEA